MTKSYASVTATQSADEDASTGQDGWSSNAFAQDQLRGSCGVGSAPSFLALADPSSRHDESVARAKSASDRIGTLVLDVTGTLIPAYLRARDTADAEAVAELGGLLIGALGAVRGTRSALGELLGGIPRQSLPGADPATDLSRGLDLQQLEGRLPTLDSFVARLEVQVVDALVPHTFQGAEVAPITLPPASSTVHTGPSAA
ncbi:MAG: hypothetical protein ABMA64_33685, partial [Myxococcota bacterium]